MGNEELFFERMKNNIIGNRFPRRFVSDAQKIFSWIESNVSSETNYVESLEIVLREKSESVVCFFNGVLEFRYQTISIQNASENSIEVYLMKDMDENCKKISFVQLIRYTPLKDDIHYENDRFIYGVNVFWTRYKSIPKNS